MCSPCPAIKRAGQYSEYTGDKKRSPQTYVYFSRKLEKMQDVFKNSLKFRHLIQLFTPVEPIFTKIFVYLTNSCVLSRFWLYFGLFSTKKERKNFWINNLNQKIKKINLNIKKIN